MTNPLVSAFELYREELVGIRRDLHAHPELGFELSRTAGIVADKLREWGLDVTEGIGRTGIVASLKGNRAGQRAIGFRADMDALPILEETNLPYASTYPGKMHACGHDGHTAMLLGAARYLTEHRDFEGQVNFIFQPAEEGLGGARAMLADGLFDRFPCDAVYGMHNMPGLPVEEFDIREGSFLAAPDMFEVTFHGTGGHGGASPHVATDVTIAHAHFILALQNVIGRNVPATEPAVISIGSITGGTAAAPNVIPSTLSITGTVRSFSSEVQDIIERRMREIAHAQAACQGCTAEVTYRRPTPALVNAPAPTRAMVVAAQALVGEDKVNPHGKYKLGSDDFSEFAARHPAAFICIGNGINEDGIFHALHTPLYDFNDDILTIGSALWVKLLLHELAPTAKG